MAEDLTEQRDVLLGRMERLTPHGTPEQPRPMDPLASVGWHMRDAEVAALQAQLAAQQAEVERLTVYLGQIGHAMGRPKSDLAEHARAMVEVVAAARDLIRYWGSWGGLPANRLRTALHRLDQHPNIDAQVPRSPASLPDSGSGSQGQAVPRSRYGGPPDDALG